MTLLADVPALGGNVGGQGHSRLFQVHAARFARGGNAPVDA
ncbi:MAG: hypothetical protein WA961_13105 [Rhodanobacter sp.]|jgi:hypothetical protein